MSDPNPPERPDEKVRPAGDTPDDPQATDPVEAARPEGEGTGPTPPG